MDSSSEFDFSLNLSSGSWDVSLNDDDGELSPILRSNGDWSLETMLSQMDTFELDIYNIL